MKEGYRESGYAKHFIQTEKVMEIRWSYITYLKKYLNYMTTWSL